MKYVLKIWLLTIVLLSCKSEEKEKKKSTSKIPQQIVLISNYAPKAYKHYIQQDSIGKQANKSGPFSPVKSPTFSYFDSQNNISNWKPKVGEIDTLVIPYYRTYLEISIRNMYTSIPNTYLIKNGDTLVIDYKHNIPVAKITNREVKDVELNYNNHRLRELFGNKYSSHHKVFLGFLLSEGKSFKETTLHFYQKALKDGERELLFLDSLYQENLISAFNYQYRKDILKGVLEKHKHNKIIKNWIAQNATFSTKENIETLYSLDLSKTDSLLNFAFFREHLGYISKYNLSFIQKNGVNSGAMYIDSRIRFDSIINDKRFNQTARNYLLPIAYLGIGQNFSVKDKKKYFEKLIENTTNPQKINELQQKYKLDFSKSDQLILTNLKNDTISFSKVLQANKGKWLYIDFWASWCAPCRKTMPASIQLKKELSQENIEFIYIGLNDQKEHWKKAIESDGISGSQHYFTENGNVSKVIEELGITSIPHYLIYNPNGELVHGFAKRPGQGAKEQLKTFVQGK